MSKNDKLVSLMKKITKENEHHAQQIVEEYEKLKRRDRVG